MIVNQTTGVYYCVDQEGNAIPSSDSQFLGAGEADVLMNRLAGGHIELPYDHIAMQLELNGYHPDDYFEFTKIVRYVPNPKYPDDSLAVVELIELVSKEDRDDWRSNIDPAQYLNRMVVVDYEANTVKWVHHPMSEDWTVPAMINGAKVLGGSVGQNILNIMRQTLVETLPVHASVIPVVTKV
jgi:hypothetical protein